MAAAKLRKPAALHQPVYRRHPARRPDRHPRPGRVGQDRLPRLAARLGDAHRRGLRARRGEPDEREVVGEPRPACSTTAATSRASSPGSRSPPHPDFRVCVTMNEDESTYEVPDYILSRLQPTLTLGFPTRDDEMEILKYHLPFAQARPAGAHRRVPPAGARAEARLLAARRDQPAPLRHQADGPGPEAPALAATPPGARRWSASWARRPPTSKSSPAGSAGRWAASTPRWASATSSSPPATRSTPTPRMTRMRWRTTMNDERPGPAVTVQKTPRRRATAQGVRLRPANPPPIQARRPVDIGTVHRDLRRERCVTDGADGPRRPGNHGTGGREGSNRNATLTYQFVRWVEHEGRGLGLVFDSSGTFVLPNGAIRSPDASWLALPRWQALTREQQKGFPPLCPDFVIELRSESDRPYRLRKKMVEYLAQGPASAG